MVYPGHPSTGCRQCIRRKVKCDEGVPACRRCINRGEQCPGYQRARYRFVTSNLRPHRRQRTNRPLETDTQSLDDSELDLSSLCTSPSVRSPSRNRQSEVLPWYFASYTIQPMPKENREAEWLNFLPAMYQESQHDSHLRLAVDAASLAAYSNHFKVYDLTPDSRKAYGTALTSLNIALQDQTEAKLDQTLTAVLNLLMFETITAGENPFGCHINGLLSMVRLRGEEQFQTPRGRMLFREVQLLLQTRPVMQKCQDSISSAEYDINADAVRILPTLSSENSRVTARVVLTFRINQLCAQASNAIHQSNIGGTQREFGLEQLMQEAELLDAKLEKWIASFPPNLHPKEVRNSQDGSRRLTHFHHMIPIAWNMYRTGRIMLHEMHLRCKLCLMKAHSAACNDSKAQQVVALVRSLAEDICDSIPFCLYEIGDDGMKTSNEPCKGKHAAAYLLLWPLLVIRLGYHTTPDQKLVATTTLERIGHEIGIKQALRLLRDRKDLFEI